MSNEHDAVAVAARRRRRARTASPRHRSGLGWLLLGLLLAPLVKLGQAIGASPRARRMLVRLTILAMILVVLASSVGVILINNVVIGRTAELGRLEDKRRELRRDNAVLGAESARRKVPGLIYRRATKELGMVQTETVPEFIYLYDGSREITQRQRQRIAARAQRRQQSSNQNHGEGETASTSSSSGEQ